MNLPNKLTILRMCLVPFFIFFALMQNISGNWLIAGIIFIVAAITDYLDGAIARKYNIVTDFGKFMDPLADKVMVVSALIVLIPTQIVHPVVVIIIIAREFAVNGIRMLAASSDGNVIAANWWGKVKTVLQIVAVILAFLVLHLDSVVISPLASSTYSFPMYYTVLVIVSYYLFWAVGIFTAISGIVYIKQNKQYIDYRK